MTTNDAIRVIHRLADDACPEGHTGALANVCTCEAHTATNRILIGELAPILMVGMGLSRVQSAPGPDTPYDEPRPGTQWCGVCKRYHREVGVKTDGGELLKPCPILSSDDPRNRK